MTTLLIHCFIIAIILLDVPTSATHLETMPLMSTATSNPPAAKPPRKPKVIPRAAPKGAKAGTKPVDPLVNARRAAMLLKQVSDATRLAVLLLLADGPRNVGQICHDLGDISQPACSHHLALCRHGRLIEPRREGKNNYYRLLPDGERLVECVRVLVEG
jgi:ArsR family transcriptional regulator, zinc-responsive transcriptional repressor